MSSATYCRACDAPLTRTFADLGLSPLSNAFIARDQANVGEVFFPLHAFVCDACFLVQLAEYEQPANIFNNDYAYFSSFSQSWLDHAARYSEAMIERFRLGSGAHVAEVALPVSSLRAIAPPPPATKAFIRKSNFLAPRVAAKSATIEALRI